MEGYIPTSFTKTEMDIDGIRKKALIGMAMGNIFAYIEYHSIKKLGENSWEITMSRAVDSEGKLVGILE